MPPSRPLAQPANQVLDREYLEMRARLLDLAAFLDRLDRGSGAASNDARLARLRQGLEILLQGDSDRAEQIQMHFSLPYEADWVAHFSRLRPA